MESGMGAVVKVGVVDIGTNSMRMLITDGVGWEERVVEVTGLGAGVDATGSLSPEAMDRTLEVLGRYGERMDEAGVERRLAIATSASRDAANRDVFFDRVEAALGVRPTLLSGDQEARYAFDGATGGVALTDGLVVSDIGGGSTELVMKTDQVSVDIGSVRLTDRLLPERPASGEQLEAATRHVEELFSGVTLTGVTHVGVAGTWTTLAAMAGGGLEAVDGSVLTSDELEEAVQRLGSLTVEETAAIPGIYPARAPVILAGAVIARAVASHLGVGETKVSERDTLDGAATALLDLR